MHGQPDFPEALRFEDRIYHPSFYTAQLYPQDAPISPPFVHLLSGTPLEFHIDDLEGSYRDLYYTIIHCTHDWQPSDMGQMDYLEGFAENTFTEMEDSFDVLANYTHYTCQVPHELTRLRFSGNYLLVVYADGDMENLIASKRFVIYEENLEIAMRVRDATAVEHARYRQEVDFTIFHPDVPIPNPYEEFHVTILQNNRWDNAIYDLKPRFVKGKELDYDYSGENCFEGGNEWRNFDYKNIRFKTQMVDSIRNVNGAMHGYLVPFGKRSFKQHRTGQDIEGKYLVRNDDAGDSNTESEYLMTHFRLPFEVELMDADVYVFGDLSNFDCTERFRMKYNAQKRSYELVVPIKQGYYNYMYAVQQRGSDAANLETIEGSHRETFNYYTVFAYIYNRMQGYDRVVGATYGNSLNQ